VRELETLVAGLQEEVAQYRRLSELGQIAVGIGHELRQPLSVINSLAYCLRTAMRNCNADQCGMYVSRNAPMAYIDRMEEQVSLANRIIAGLGEYARTHRAAAAAIDLNMLLDREVAQLEVPENVRVLRQLEQPSPRAFADPVHVERMFHVLATNALQSMEAAGGELVLRTASDGAAVLMEISDTGAGVSDAVRDKLFLPFFTNKTSGLGLGLALARQLAVANNGSIEFRPASPHGAIFRVRLPKA